MSGSRQTGDSVEVLFTVEGHAAPFGAHVPRGITVGEFVAVAKSESGATNIADVFLEDATTPLDYAAALVGSLTTDFKPIHVAAPGKIRTTVKYSTRDVTAEFGPNVTLETVIVWAIAPGELNLVGTPSDFQLKLDGKALSPDFHLGQVARGAKAITFELVFKVKPQGA